MEKMAMSENHWVCCIKLLQGQAVMTFLKGEECIWGNLFAFVSVPFTYASVLCLLVVWDAQGLTVPCAVLCALPVLPGWGGAVPNGRRHRVRSAALTAPWEAPVHRGEHTQSPRTAFLQAFYCPTRESFVSFRAELTQYQRQ